MKKKLISQTIQCNKEKTELLTYNILNNKIGMEIESLGKLKNLDKLKVSNNNSFARI